MAPSKVGSATARKRSSSRAATVLARKSRVQGWLSSDEQEIERRRQRAVTEPIEIEAVEGRYPHFGTFAVGAPSGGRYQVEIRSLSERVNSCSCPDHQINGLGTCKHVEAVMARLPRRPPAVKRPRGSDGSESKEAAAARSGRVEVFLDRRLLPPRVKVQWPGDGTAPHPLRKALGPLFAADGILRGNALDALPALARRLAQQPRALQQRVRLSHQLQPWLEEQRRKAARGAARDRFLAEVESGRRRLDLLNLPLYPYQRAGMLHLAFGERALLADEMGLGKTVQAVAGCELLRQLRGIERVLVISPASVKAEWLEQIAKFTRLPARVIQGPRAMRLRQYTPGAFFYLANYEQILVDFDDIQRHLTPDVIVLDEAQRIKNWQSKTAQAVKRLRSPYAFVLTGTPIENRIDELYSLAQFLDPSLFGPLFRFNRDFYQLDDRGRPIGLKNLGEMHRRIGGILLRRRKDEVEDQLPGRTVNSYFLPMEPEQEARYREYEMRVAKLLYQASQRPLTPEEFDKLQQWLACMRMLCDTPYILDAECRICPKLGELEEILTERLAEPGAKILVFSEWERMLLLVRELVEEMGVGFAWHTGSVPQPRRRQEIRRFKDDPTCRLFLSTDSGSLGLNLQTANVVINLDLPWNPARLEQRIARAWRKHQTRAVSVLNLVTQDSIEHRMLGLLAQKQALADGVLDGRGDLKSLALPTGRAAFLERLEAVMGGATAQAPAPPAAPAPTEPDAAPQRLRDALLQSFSDRLLLLSLRGEPGGREAAVFAVLDRVSAKDHAAVAALVERSLAGEGSASPPSLELFDRATFAAIERLIEAGVLQFTGSGASLLHRSPGLSPGEEDRERQRRLIRSRELCAQAERKSRMAALLASGGFPVEALVPLREALEIALRALVLAEEGDRRPQEDGDPAPEVPLAWIESNLSRHELIAPAIVQLVADLRGRSEALLAVDEAAAGAWLASGERAVAEIAQALAGAT
jgi:hypothetical protein